VPANVTEPGDSRSELLAGDPQWNSPVSDRLRRRIVRGGTLAALGNIAAQGISLISFVALARLAPPSTFGSYAAASILLATSALFVEAGMQAAVIQRQERVDEAASTAFVANVIGGVGLAALAAACAPLIGLFFHSGEIGKAAAVMAATIPLNAAAIVPGALLARRLSFRFAALDPLASLAYGTTAVVALSTGLRLWGLVLATLVAAATRTAAVLVLAAWRPSLQLVSWEMWRSLSRYGRPVVLSAFFREIGTTGSTAVVGRALGTAGLGRFRAAQRLVQQSNSAIIFGSAYVLLPVFSRIWKDQRRLQDSILRALRTLTLIVFPLSLVFIPLGRPFATILLGHRWAGAGPIMMALSAVGAALAIDSVCSEVFKAVGRTDLLPRMSAISAFGSIALMFPLLTFGTTGIGAAISIAMLAVTVYAVRNLSRITSIEHRVIVAQIRPALSAALVMAAGTYPLERYVVRAQESHGLVGLALLVLDLAIAAALYLGSLLVVSRPAVTELKGAVKLLVGRLEGSASTATG
jgi:O-antigen/teichoic acid export membrane protein